MTDSEFTKLKQLVGVYQEGINYNKIYDGNPAVDISDKVGSQFTTIKDEDKKTKLIEYLQGFYNEYPQYENSIEIDLILYHQLRTDVELHFYVKLYPNTAYANILFVSHRQLYQ